MNVIKFFDEISKLKEIKRTGWVERGVKLPESVADHSFMVALQVLVLGSERNDIDVTKALRMAVVHDLAESQVGDIITKEAWPAGGSMTVKEKASLEKLALAKILKPLNSKLAKEISTLWSEFEDGESREATFVKSVDKFEGLMQAMRYHKTKNFRKPLKEYWGGNFLNSIKDAEIRKLAEKLVEKK